MALATGLVGSAALLGHALNAPALRAYQQSQACGLGTAVAPDCRLLVQGTILDDRRLPLGIHALTLSTDSGRAVYYGRAEADRSSDAGAAASAALLVVWQGRTARVIGQGMILEPFAGPPGSALLLIVLAIVCELACALALGLQGATWRLRARFVPTPGGGAPRSWPVGRPILQFAFVVALALALLAGRSGHAAIAVPLHTLCGAAAVGILAANGWSSGRALVAVAGRGLDGLSDEPALRLGSDVALAGVLVALCASLTADLVVNDLLTLPR
ncbi:MAG TPA: hypothetical protein VOB72_00850 [Candidatus Dormibacteraeota bacterium]|nr:hypothetical protein [Candidatus Dormibacteraeota bacterium]